MPLLRSELTIISLLNARDITYYSVMESSNLYQYSTAVRTGNKPGKKPGVPISTDNLIPFLQISLTTRRSSFYRNSSHLHLVLSLI